MLAMLIAAGVLIRDAHMAGQVLLKCGGRNENIRKKLLYYSIYTAVAFHVIQPLSIVHSKGPVSDQAIQ